MTIAMPPISKNVGNASSRQSSGIKTFLLGCLCGWILRGAWTGPILPSAPSVFMASVSPTGGEVEVPASHVEVPASHVEVPAYHKLAPLEHSAAPIHAKITANGQTLPIDAFNPFHHYEASLSRFQDSPPDFPDLPFLNTWIHYAEAYHNHFSRFRGRDRVIFAEVGVQSGGKIPMLRDYFGPGFIYIGIDINPSTLMFQSADWIHIEIGDSESPQFWETFREKYPIIDIFLDDGGHTMTQQKMTMKEMLAHVQPDGVFACEDLATSWAPVLYGGKQGGSVLDPDFVRSTMQGLIHQSMDWLHAGFLLHTDGIGWGDTTAVPSEGIFSEEWWRVVMEQVKHIHYYNQIVVYEKGITYAPTQVQTVGKKIPDEESGTHEPVDWDPIMKRVQEYTKSHWDW
jgi:hypothetical protein